MESSKLDIILKNIRSYLVEMNLDELDIKIRKLNVALDNSAIHVSEIEITPGGKI